MHRSIYLLFMLIFSFHQIKAQTSADTTRANQFFATGKELFKQAKYDSASIYLQKAAEIYQNHVMWNRYVRCYNLLGNLAQRRGHLDQALTWLNQALDVIKRGEEIDIGLQAQTHQILGEVYKAKDAYNQALSYLNQALKLQLQASGERNNRTANIYLYIGLIHEKKGSFNRALEAYQKTLTIRRALFGETHGAVADCYNNIGLIYWKIGDYNTALQYQQKALQIRQQIHKNSTHPDLSMSYNNIAGLYWSKGDYDRSLDYLKKVLDIHLEVYGERDPQTAKTFSNLGAVYFSKGDYDRALAYQHKALEIGLKNPEGYALEIVTYYKNIGEVLIKKGDYERALQFAQKALAYGLKVFGKRHPEVGRSYASIGSLAHALGDTSLALDHLRQALKIYLQVFGERHAEVAAVFNTMAEVYRDAGAARIALENSRKALAISRKLFGEQHPVVARHYQTLGSIYLQAGKPETALKFARKAGDIQVAVLGANHPELAKSHLLMARAQHKLGNDNLALLHLDKALRANLLDLDVAHRGDRLIPSEKVLSDLVLLETLHLKARVLEGRFRRSNEIDDLQAAFTVLNQTTEVLDRVRSGYRAEGSKLVLAQKVKSVYEEAIRVALVLHATTGMTEYKHKAFVFSEKAKVSVLREAMMDVNARRFAGLPDSLLQQERDLRVDLAYYSIRIQEEELKRAGRDSVLLVEFRNRYFELSRRYEALLERFELDFPQYYNLKYRNTVISISQIQQRLDEKTTLLAYFLGDSALYLFTISRNQFNITVRQPVTNLEQSIKVLRKSMTHNQGEGDYYLFTTTASLLYKSLIRPVENYLKTPYLVIIPDEILNTLPFEVLLTAEANQKKSIDYTTLPYLLNRFSISYAYSATLLMATAVQPYQAPPYDYLAFAPVFSSGLPAESRALDLVQSNLGMDELRVGLNHIALPASREEVLTIEDLFKQNYGLTSRIKLLIQPKTRVYLEKEASETNFKRENLKAYRFLHLATHGFANKNAPDLSGLLFTPEADSSEDGVLYLPEIYNLTLNAELVVVSACESGTGKLIRGEGLLGLTRGFLYAGARNLLVSLWQVGDWSTADLMHLFYQRLLAGTDKSEALRQAKLELMRSHPDYARPYHWAPFILIGI